MSKIAIHAGQLSEGQTSLFSRRKCRFLKVFTLISGYYPLSGQLKREPSVSPNSRPPRPLWDFI